MRCSTDPDNKRDCQAVEAKLHGRGIVSDSTPQLRSNLELYIKRRLNERLNTLDRHLDIAVKMTANLRPETLRHPPTLPVVPDVSQPMRYETHQFRDASGTGPSEERRSASR